MALKIGDVAIQKKRIVFDDIKKFAELSGDINPVHIDPEFAKSTPFKKVIAHGMYVSSFISAIMANELPGPGSIYLGQELKFTKPAYVDDEVTVEVKVIEFPRESFVKLSTNVTNQNGEALIKGTALVKVL